MTTERIAELRALADACFRGPWTATDWTVDCEGDPGNNCDGGCTRCDGEGTHEQIAIESPDEYPDGQVVGVIDLVGLQDFARPHAAFIASARTALPELLDEVERLEAEGARLRDALDRARAALKGTP